MSCTTTDSRPRLPRLLRAFCFSVKGLCTAWRDEAAFRQELICFAILGPLTVILPIAGLSKAFLLCQMASVLVVELLNSGLEAIVDKASPEQHELAAKAKDCASAAVLLTCLALVGSWLTLAAPAVVHAVAAFLPTIA